MGASEQRIRSQRNAADLLKRGFWHGKRQSVTHAPPVPNMTDTGSAAYRRLQKSSMYGKRAGMFAFLFVMLIPPHGVRSHQGSVHGTILTRSPVIHSVPIHRFPRTSPLPH